LGGALIQNILEYIRVTHNPLPPPHRVILYNGKASSCDIKARTIKLGLKSEYLEWDYRHEIEHLNKYPRREGIVFKHYFKARKQVIEKYGYDELELFKKNFKEISNITYDAYIDYELAQRYPNVKIEIANYVKKLPSKAFVYPHEEARKLAVNGVKPKWLTDNIADAMVYVYERIKQLLESKLKLKLKLDINLHGNFDEIACGIVELLDEGYNWSEVKQAVKEYYEIIGEECDWSELSEAYIDALIRSRFQFTIKATFDTKVAFSEVRECWDTWRLGESIDELEFNESLRSYGMLIPGQNTLKKTTIPARRGVLKRHIGGAHIAILVDCSGSMKEHDKWIYARDAVLMLIGYAMKYHYNACLSIFTDYNVWCHEWTSNYYDLARRFIRKYNPDKMSFHSYTSITSSLNWLASVGRRDMTIYLISDMEVEETENVNINVLRKLLNYKPKIVFFLISSDKNSLISLVEEFKETGFIDVSGYWVNPRSSKNLRDKLIRELNL